MSRSPRRAEDPVRVLLVDADPSARRAVSALLERRLGLTVVTAHGGMQALSLLRRQVFDLVVVDPEMPEMGGSELLGRLAQLFPRVPVAVFSAGADGGRARGASVRLRVPKAAGVEALLQALQAELGVGPLRSGIHALRPRGDDG